MLRTSWTNGEKRRRLWQVAAAIVAAGLLALCCIWAMTAVRDRALLHDLASEDDSQQAAAMRALTERGEAVTPMLMRALANGRPQLRAASAATLGQTGDGRAIPSLIAALSDPDRAVSAEAATAIGRYGSEAIPQLMGAYHEGDLGQRIGAVRALSKMDDVRAVDALLRMLDDPAEAVADEVADALSDKGQ